jgi:glutathione S-transferase
MKLIYSPTSPYARKVRVVILEKNLESQVDLVNLAPSELPVELLEANALSRIPTLVRDNGSPLIDSPFICEYLDSLGNNAGTLSGIGEDLWAVKHLHAMGDGVIDTVFTISMERRRNKSEQSPVFIKGQVARVQRTVNALNKEVGTFSREPKLGELAMACALGYIDLRLSNDLDWRNGNSPLSNWFSEISKRPSLINTEPPK